MTPDENSAEAPYNPLDKKNLGVSVMDAILAKQPSPLPPADPFDGAGIYALYYTGEFAPYLGLSRRNKGGRLRAPIYVGKAIPAGARRGGGLNQATGPVLYKRLTEHAKSIEEAGNLDLKDFSCRYLVVDDIWIPLGESLLIENLSPLWNTLVDGFGNHDPGSGRHNQQRSPWDVLHPGRAWAERLKPYSKTQSQILSQVGAFLKERHP